MLPHRAISARLGKLPVHRTAWTWQEWTRGFECSQTWSSPRVRDRGLLRDRGESLDAAPLPIRWRPLAPARTGRRSPSLPFRPPQSEGRGLCQPLLCRITASWLSRETSALAPPAASLRNSVQPPGEADATWAPRCAYRPRRLTSHTSRLAMLRVLATQRSISSSASVKTSIVALRRASQSGAPRSRRIARARQIVATSISARCAAL